MIPSSSEDLKVTGSRGWDKIHFTVHLGIPTHRCLYGTARNNPSY
jgi:hypothetical protein